MVPNITSTQCLVRVTDLEGITGTSGMFSIQTTPGDGSIDAITLTGQDNNSNIANNEVLGISWTFTPDIGTSVDVQYSLDNAATWNSIAIVQVSDPQNTSWTTPMVGQFNPVYIRVTSSNGATRASSPFSIGVTTGLLDDEVQSGYVVSSYPNPAGDLVTVQFTMPVSNNVALSISDVQGNIVASLVSQHFDAGVHTVPINTTGLSSGVYTYIFQSETVLVSGKMFVVR
jgi:hypothetical protein